MRMVYSLSEIIIWIDKNRNDFVIQYYSPKSLLKKVFYIILEGFRIFIVKLPL